MPAPECLPDRYGPGAGGAPRCVCPTGAVADEPPLSEGGRLTTSVTPRQGPFHNALGYKTAGNFYMGLKLDF